MHDQRSRILLASPGIDQDEIEHALGFRIHPARQIETGQIDPRRRAPIGLGRSRRSGERPLSRDEVLALVLAPLGDIENRPDRGRRALGRDIGRRQRQAAGPAEGDLVGRYFGGDVIGIQTNRDAVDRFQQRQLDEILLPDEAANGWRRRDHQQGIAGVRIEKPVQRAVSGQRHRNIGVGGIADVAYRRQRLRLASASHRQRSASSSRRLPDRRR